MNMNMKHAWEHVRLQVRLLVQAVCGSVCQCESVWTRTAGDGFPRGCAMQLSAQYDRMTKTTTANQAG